MFRMVPGSWVVSRFRMVARLRVMVRLRMVAELRMVIRLRVMSVLRMVSALRSWSRGVGSGLRLLQVWRRQSGQAAGNGGCEDESADPWAE